MPTSFYIILVILNVPVYIGVGWVVFGSWFGFRESLRFWLTPDIISLFKGEYWEDAWGEMKMGLWIVGCVFCVIMESVLISKFLT